MVWGIRRSRHQRALREFRRAQRVFTEVGHAEGVALARLAVGSMQRLRGRTTIAIRELAAASEELSRLASPDRDGVTLWGSVRF